MSGQARIHLTQYREQARMQNRAVCLTCSKAVTVRDESVACGASGRDEDYTLGRCRLRKWPCRPPELPGVWVLAYPRTGSYYLCAVLNRLGFRPPIRELYNPGIVSPPSLPPRSVKVHPDQFESRGLTLGQVARYMPETRFIVIRRRDLVACAVSRYIAEYTNTWEVHTDRQAEALASEEPIPFDESWIRRCYKQCLRDDAYWQDALQVSNADVCEIFYEDLVAWPAEVVRQVTAHLGIEADTDRALAGITNRKQSVYRPESGLYHRRLSELLAGGSSWIASGGQINPSKLIVGTLACTDPAYAGRRRRCLETWLPGLESAGVEVLFLVGVGDAITEPRVVEQAEHGRIGRELQIPCPDSYEALPQKTAAFCRWACRHREFDFLFKCDDDTYLIPQRLLAMDLSTTDYLGAELRRGIKYASGGGGYFLSHRAARVVATQMNEATGFEDLLVAQYLNRHGMFLEADQRFVAMGIDNHFPRPENDQITCHAYERPWVEHARAWSDQPI